jgi:hypothetical protein
MRASGPVGVALGTLVRFFRSGLLWWGAVIAAGFLAIELAASHWGEPDQSIWAYAGTPVRWVMLVLGILAVPSLFRVLVAHGVTRRSFAAAGGAAIGLLAVVTGCFMVAGFLVERVLYTAADQPTTLAEQHLFDSTGQLHLVFAEYALITAAYLATGWLVGAGYLRFGWLRGTLALPAAAIPVAGVEFLLGTGRTSGWGTGELDITAPALPLGVALLLAVALVGLGLLAGRWLLYPVPAKPKTS